MPHTLKIGDTRIIALPDGFADLPGRPVPESSLAESPMDWPAYARAFPDGFHGEGHFWRIHNNCWAVEAGASRILVDCGVGVGPYQRYADMRGQLASALSAAGLDFGSFDVVFLSHAHPDHVGWAYDETAKRPRFPNARYLLHQKDWTHFNSRDVVPPYFRRFLQPLRDAGVLELLAGETEFAGGVTALETPGHTPGSMSLLVRSNGEGIVFAADVLNSPVYITEPERPFGSDADEQLGIRTRIALIDRIEAEGWHVAAEHFPAPGWGKVVRVEGRRWFQAL